MTQFEIICYIFNFSFVVNSSVFDDRVICSVLFMHNASIVVCLFTLLPGISRHVVISTDRCFIVMIYCIFLS